MDFNKYQEGALETAQYPSVYVEETPVGFVYPALGLAGEAGEVAEKCKKLIRDNRGTYSEGDVDSIKKELGDVLWYLAVLASEFGITLEDIATTNYNKLKSRKERDVIKGSGDDR